MADYDDLQRLHDRAEREAQRADKAEAVIAVARKVAEEFTPMHTQYRDDCTMCRFRRTVLEALDT